MEFDIKPFSGITYILEKFTSQFGFIKIWIQVGMVSIVDSIIQTLNQCKARNTVKSRISNFQFQKWSKSTSIRKGKYCLLTGDSVCSVSMEANEPAIVEMWSIVSFWLELSCFALNFSNPDHIIWSDRFSYRLQIKNPSVFLFLFYVSLSLYSCILFFIVLFDYKI